MSAAPASLPFDAPAVHVLHPGDVVCAGQGARLETLLGSCVAVILTDPRRTVGAMCHIVHSGRNARRAPDSTAYAEMALATMYRQLRERGIVPTLCEAYVYGGGNMFPDLVTDTHVGEHNVHWALAALRGDGVRVLHQNVGGCSYRRLAWTVGPTAPQLEVVPVCPAPAAPGGARTTGAATTEF